MIIAYTGLPGGGKSLSAIQDYVLPQLKKGRRVFCNIAGLCPMRIAARLGMTTPEVSRLLKRFSMSFNDDAADHRRIWKEELWDGSAHYCNGQGLNMLIDDVLSHKDAVVVIDECHEYLSPSNFSVLVNFKKYMSMARHHGHDLVLITQHITDVWETLRNRVHETHNFTRGRLGLRAQYIESVFHGWNVFERPGYSRSRMNDKSLYGLYKSREAGASERMGYASIFRSRKLVAMIAGCILCFLYSGVSIARNGLFGGVGASSAAAAPAPDSPAPEYNSGGNAIYVKYVVCGALDCKAARPDGSTITLPLDYASGKYPFEVKRYAPGSSHLPSFMPGPRPGQ